MSKPVTILIVDDDFDIRNAVEQCLLDTDIKPTTITAPNAVLGLQLAKKHIPDVVVLDLQMPLGSGFDFVTELKRDSTLSNVKILILTAEATPGNIWKSIDKDVDDILAKPFDIVELEGRVKLLLAKKRAGSGTL